MGGAPEVLTLADLDMQFPENRQGCSNAFVGEATTHVPDSSPVLHAWKLMRALLRGLHIHQSLL